MVPFQIKLRWLPAGSAHFCCVCVGPEIFCYQVGHLNQKPASSLHDNTLLRKVSCSQSAGVMSEDKQVALDKFTKKNLLLKVEKSNNPCT